jgi:Serine hydroxymethyltransferase
MVPPQHSSLLTIKQRERERRVPFLFDQSKLGKDRSGKVLPFSHTLISTYPYTMTTIPKTLPGNTPLAEHDPEMADLIEKEKTRQWSCLELIASENFTSRAVMECLGSALTNKVRRRRALLHANTIMHLGILWVCGGGLLKGLSDSFSFVAQACVQREV